MSDFVMACGVHLVRERLADLCYLSLTDFVQHTYAPGLARGRRFLQRRSTTAWPSSTRWGP